MLRCICVGQSLYSPAATTAATILDPAEHPVLALLAPQAGRHPSLMLIFKAVIAFRNHSNGVFNVQR